MRGFRAAWVGMVWLAAVASAGAADVWVDNSRGNDSGDGSRAKPFATIEKGVAALKPGTTLHLVPNDKPYPGDVRIERVNATPEARIVFDGHGARVTNLRRLPAADWTAEGGGVFSRKLPNNAWGMEKCWEGGFELVRFDGKPGRNVTKREDVAPGCYFLYKNQRQLKEDKLHNTLYIRLPEGKTPDDVAVESIDGRGGVYVGSSYVTVRNVIAEYGGTDGFATHRGKGIVFENVEASHFMDQGMSHHGAEVVVRRAHFHHNAGCGVVDVYDECRTRYENCLIESDTWRGGVEFLRGQYEMDGCVIRFNASKSFSVGKGARVSVSNCVFMASPGRAEAGVIFGDGQSTLELANCTIGGFAIGLRGALSAGARLTVRDCAFLNCGTNVMLAAVQGPGEAPVVIADVFKASGNLHEPAPWRISVRKRVAADVPWEARDHFYGPAQHEGFSVLAGTDGDARVEAVAGAADPLSAKLPPGVGAHLTPDQLGGWGVRRN